MLEEVVHVEVGKEGANHPALRRAAGLALAAHHAPLVIAVPFLAWHLEPQLDQPQHVPVNDAPGHTLQEIPVRDRVEVLRQIGVHHVGVAPADEPVHFLVQSRRDSKAA